MTSVIEAVTIAAAPEDAWAALRATSGGADPVRQLMRQGLAAIEATLG